MIIFCSGEIQVATSESKDFRIRFKVIGRDRDDNK